MSEEPATYHPWSTYLEAREEARRLGDRRVGTDHLLLGLLHDPSIASAFDVSPERAREAIASLDRRALSSIGVDVAFEAPALPPGPMPPRPTIKAVFTGRLPLTPEAKACLRAVRPPRRREGFTPELIALPILDTRPPDPGAALLDALEVDRPAVRARLMDRLAA